MRLFSFLILTLLTSYLYSQKACPNPQNNKMHVLAPGTGPIQNSNFSKDFTCSTCFHFVQFGVYQANTDKYNIRAPKAIDDVWLIRHDQTMINGRVGAMYMVKAFATERQAREFASQKKHQGISCWYNPRLTGSDFVLLSVAQ